MRRARRVSATACAIVLALAACKRPDPTSPPAPPVEQGTGWRGDGTGKFPDADPPLTWSREENILWRTPLPAWSNASPVLAGGRVFVCAEPTTLLCLDAATGTILWQKTNDYLDLLAPDQAAQAQAALDASAGTRRDLQKAEQAQRRARKEGSATNLAQLDARVAELQRQLGSVLSYELPPTEARLNGYSTPTPATDGRRVFALFGNGVAAAYDLDGTRLWARVVEKPVDEFGQSASPLLAGGKLFVAIHSLHALDPETGRTVWKVPAKHGWGTPVLAAAGAEPAVATTGGELFRLRDGFALTTKCPRLSYNSPVWDAGALFYMEGKAHAIRLAASRKADKTERETLWDITLPGDRYYASPIVQAGLVFAVNQQGDLTATDAKNGTIAGQRKLDAAKGATFYPSLALAGGRLFATSDDGTTHIVTADRELRPLGTGQGEPLRSSLTFSGTRVYARTLEALVCIGK